jgi:hypothetical protein
LSGLNSQEQLSLFRKIGLNISESSQEEQYLNRIGIVYEGHPLALKVIAGEIKDRPFNGDVTTYWNKYGDEIEKVERAIESGRKGSLTGKDHVETDRFTQNLRMRVRRRLDTTFERLKKDAPYSYILLCEASIYRCPVPEKFWLNHLSDWDRTEDERRTALTMLQQRYLVEEVKQEDHKLFLKQHNLIRSVSLELLETLDDLQ